MQILLIAGFLGSGKTEFIKTMVGATKKNFVILENEFGDLNFDADRIRDVQIPNFEDAVIDVEELTEGCICCSMNLDISLSVLTIANSLDPDYLIIEPSGVALPSRIIEKLSPILYERIGLIEPITILDGERYHEHKLNFPSYLRDQLNTAGTILVSHSENWGDEDYQTVRRELEIPEHVRMPASHYGNWRDWQFLELLDRPLPIEGKRAYEALPTPPDEEQLEHLTMPEIEVDHPWTLLRQLDAIIHGHYGYVVRGKGQVRVGSELLSFDLVSDQFTINGTPMGDQVGVVMIGQDLNEDALQELFEAKKKSHGHNHQKS